MEFKRYSQEDAFKDGIGYTVSEYSTKLIIDNQVIGFVIFEDKRLLVNDEFINSCKNEDANMYYQSINKANSVYLRKISILNDYAQIGAFEQLFNYVTIKVLPRDFLIWCYPIVCGKRYLEQIGGFFEPLYPLPNKNIRIYSMEL